MKINQFSPNKTKTFLRRKFLESARLYGHLAFLSLIENYDEDIYNDPIITYDKNDDGSLTIRNISLVFDNELSPNKYRYWNKDLKSYVNGNDSYYAYVWLEEVTDTDEFEVINKLYGSIVRWSYYDERHYGLDSSRSYKIVEIMSDPSYVLKVKLVPYINDNTNVIESKSESTNYKFTKED
jgi:hypothetical protein